VDRRKLLQCGGAALGAAFTPLRAIAQAAASGGIRTIGTLSPSPPPPPERSAQVLRRFAEMGWVAKENLAFERPAGREEDLPQMAASLVQKRVDVIWAIGPEAAVAAARATQRIPIVFWGVALPVELGLTSSLARPSGNVTGVAFFTGAELFSKQMEFLRMIVPPVRRLAWISTPSAGRTVSGAAVDSVSRLVETSAQALGFEFRRHSVERDEDFAATFEAIAASRVEALGVSGTALTWRNRALITEFSNRRRLPSAFNQPEFVDEGGLFSYGANTIETIDRTIEYINRVLRGARPAEMPVELPSRYELVINLRTARTLGLKIAPSVLVRADRVIE
jgi:putative ABC transport system substrate-binding protein